MKRRTSPRFGWYRKIILPVVALILTTCTNPLMDDLEKAAAYPIGSPGPAGGTIFSASLIDGHWRCFEVAPYGWYNGGADPEAEWGLYGEALSTYSRYLGEGKAKTEEILLELQTSGETGTAAQLCAAYSVIVNGKVYNDWHLPSELELHELCVEIVKDGHLQFDDRQYWSSTDPDYSTISYNGTYFAITYNPNEEYSNNPIFRYEQCRVRPIRMF